MFKKLILIIISICLVFSLSCSKKENKPNIKLPDNPNMNFPYSFVDSAGNELTLYEEPKNVAVLSSSFAEIWTLAGGTVNISVTKAKERGAADSNCIIVDTQSNNMSIDTELLISSEPDLVIGSSDHENQIDAVRLCRKAGIPSAIFNIKSFSDYLNVLKISTDLLNRPSNFKKYGTDIEEKIKSLLEVTDELGSTTNILFLRIETSTHSLRAETKNESFVCTMLDELGTYNIAADIPSIFYNITAEEMITKDPEIIFIAVTGDEAAAKEYLNSLFESEPYSSLTAVKQGNCHFLPDDLFGYEPNEEWYDAYLYLAKIIYPNTDLEA